MSFKLISTFQPTGDQPEAIRQLVRGVNNGEHAQVLLGVTGSGKTFTIANLIEKVQKPTLILTHNKTLTAQLYSEFKEFFPDNAGPLTRPYNSSHLNFQCTSLRLSPLANV